MPAATPDRARGRWARAGAASFVLLCVLLPALVAGLRLDAPATAGELRRLEAAFAPGSAPARSDVADLFYLAAVDAGSRSLPAAATEQAALVGAARLAQIAFVGALSGLVYLSALLARGRIAAALACICLAILPPIAHEGHVLRPETPAAVLALLGVLLLQCLARSGRSGRGPLRLAAAAESGGLCLAASLAAALSLAVLPTDSVLLLVPGGVLCVIAAQLGWRTTAVLRRRGPWRVPMYALNRRLAPWTAATLLAPVAAAWVVHVAVHGSPGDLAPTVAGAPLVPDAVVGAAVIVLLAIGVGAAILRVGTRLGRRERAGPELVLFVYVGVLLTFQATVQPGLDALRAAPAVAIAVGEGAFAVATLVFGSLARRRGRTRATPRS